jgi:hypothetical protein
MKEHAITIRLASENTFVNERVPPAWMTGILPLGANLP